MDQQPAAQPRLGGAGPGGRRDILPRCKVIAGSRDAPRQFAKDLAQRRQRKILRAESRLQQLVERVERPLGVALQAFPQAPGRGIGRERRQPLLDQRAQVEQQEPVVQFGPGRRRQRQPFLPRQTGREKFDPQQRVMLAHATELERVRLAAGGDQHKVAAQRGGRGQPRAHDFAPGGIPVADEMEFALWLHGRGDERQSAGQTQPFIAPAAAQKNPATGWSAGRKGWRRSGYFFVAKMYFAYCDLWCEAALRWMTLLLTALSRAEQ